MLKNYRIEIVPRNGFIVPTGIPMIFGCSVSEPSAWTAAARGLTITDEAGSPIDNHPVLTHRTVFGKQLPGDPVEQLEVDAMIWSMLQEANIGPAEVNVRVTYVNSMP